MQVAKVQRSQGGFVDELDPILGSLARQDAILVGPEMGKERGRCICSHGNKKIVHM